MLRKAWIERLKADLSPRRYEHTLSVEQTAIMLADLHGIDTGAASHAALLHDNARCFSLDYLQSLAEKYELKLDEMLMSSVALLHGPVGAYRAKEIFSVNDEEILTAIRWHTTGRPGMSALEKIIFLADMIEPTRKPFPALDKISETCKKNLDIAMNIALKSSIEYVLDRGQQLYSATEQAYSYYSKFKED